jgi:hypothetical protein
VEQLSAPAAEPAHVRRVEAERRKLDRGSEKSAPEIALLDRQIADLAATIVEVGRSDGLTAKLRELEARKRDLALQRSAGAPRFLNGAAEEWRRIVANLAWLGDVSTPDELEEARTLLADLIGEVAVVERPDGVVGF